MTADWDSTVRIWDAESGAELLVLPGQRFAELSPDGTQLLTAPNYQLIIYDSRPVNRAFLPREPAPPPQAVTPR